jgi:hypothetical protein
MTNPGETPKEAIETMPETGRQMTLFPNPIPSNFFGVVRGLADNFNRALHNIDREQAKQSYKTRGREYKISESEAIRITDTGIKDADQFAERLMQLKDAKIVKTLLTLNAFANEQGSFLFKGVRLSALMELANLKKPKAGYTQKQREQFSEAINFLKDLEITLEYDIKDKDEKGKIVEDRRRDYFKILTLYGTTHSKHTKDIIDKKTGAVIYKRGEADTKIIKRLTCELLPRLNKSLIRGRLMPKAFLTLDAGRDERAILLGYKLAVRFDQLRGVGKRKQKDNSEIVITIDRDKLIEWADYTLTDADNKSRASHLLQNTLKKLIEADIISRYIPETISTIDGQQISIYPGGASGLLPEGAK